MDTYSKPPIKGDAINIGFNSVNLKDYYYSIAPEFNGRSYLVPWVLSMMHW
jgi:hypothetical protein